MSYEPANHSAANCRGEIKSKQMKKTSIWLRKVMHIFPARNRMILESKPAFSDNTYYVYIGLIENNINNCFEIVWIVQENEQINQTLPANVRIFRGKRNIFNRLHRLFLLETSKCVITCNFKYMSTRKGHINLHLGHGIGIKDTKEIMYLNKCIDIVTIHSECFRSLAKRAYDVPDRKIITTGYPRTDALIKGISRTDLPDELQKYHRIIIWMPTFRINKKRVDSSYKMPFGIPVLSSEDELLKLNSLLKQHHSLLIIKYHFAQSKKNALQTHFSNIRIIDNDYLIGYRLDLYRLISATDALITDYSTVYFEYLLMKKPIGLTMDDIKEYGEERGFVFDSYTDNMKGEYIHSYEELSNFIRKVVTGYTFDLSEQIKAKDIYNDFYDGKSTQRVLDLLFAQLKKHQDEDSI